MKNLNLCACLFTAVMATPAVHADVTETGDVTENGAIKFVGNTGVGAYTVDDDADAVEGTMRFGQTSTGDGTGLVTGAGSSLTLDNGVLTVGRNGTGRFTIADGGTVLITRDPTATDPQGGFVIAQEEGGVGEIVVTGAGSSLTGSAGVVWMGGRGEAVLTVEDNATVTAFGPTVNNPLFRAAQHAGGQATINVRTGGLLDITGPGQDTFDVAERGQGTVNIESGGQLLAGRMRVGLFGGASAEININGDGSLLQVDLFSTAKDPNTDDITVNLGDGAALRVETELYIGEEGTSVFNVTGGASVETGTDSGPTDDRDFFIGYNGKGTMRMSEASSARAREDFYIGWDNGDGTVVVTDAGTTLVVDRRFFLGWGTSSSPATAALDVGRGGLVQALSTDGSVGGGLGLAINSNDTATLTFTIGDDGAGSIASGLIEAGNFFFGGGTSTLELMVDSGVVLDLGDMFTLIDYASWDGDLFANVADDAIVSFGGYDFLIDYDTDLGGGDLALTATVVPEPTSLALLGLGGLLIARRNRD